MGMRNSYVRSHNQSRNGKTIKVTVFWRKRNYVVTEEQRRKISETLMGRKLPEKTRKKMSEGQRKWWKNASSLSKRKRYDAMINLWKDENAEHRRQKLREAMRGDKNPAKRAEVKRKISKALKGNQHGLGNKSHLGQKLSPEHKRKLSEARKGQKLSEEWKHNIAKAQNELWQNPEYHLQQSKRISEAMKNLLNDAEYRKQRSKTSSATLKKLWRDPEYRVQRLSQMSQTMSQLWNDPAWRQNQITKTLKGLFKRPTSLERQFIKICERNGLPFKYVGDGEFLIGSRNPDFIHRDGMKVCVEVANLYHHPTNYEQERKTYFSKFGWDCIVFRGNHLDEATVLSKLRGVD